MNSIVNILKKERLEKEDLIMLLSCNAQETEFLFEHAALVKRKHIGNKVHMRGLIELTNQCAKNCYYCGIRKDNKSVHRYFVKDKEIKKAIEFAVANELGSIVFQSGELCSPNFTDKVENLLLKTKDLSKGTLGITLSCGEQDEETYKRWKDAGAHRYLLRIESSNEELYYKIHPKDEQHNYQKRINALQYLKKCGYQTGTGVMIGLPFQTIEDLANDLLLMRELDIAMCGMGPYIEHEQTPLTQFDHLLPSKDKRLELSLKMIAILRIIMKDINIASTTALQTLSPEGRELALKVGANIMMPNITPGLYREQYSLYKNKPGLNEEAEDSKKNLDALIRQAGCIPAYGEWGDSKHTYI